VLRFYSRDRATAVRERDLLALLAATPVRCPRSLGLVESDGRSVGILEYVDGVSLEERLLAGPPPDLSLYTELGRALAGVHAVTFAEAGFLGEGGRPGREYADFSLFLRDFIEKTLAWLEAEHPERLDGATIARVRRLIAEQWDHVLATERRRQLVHCDFNPKNLLVSRGPGPKLLAVIDWEFCVSGNGLIDLANFFRFEADYAPEAGARFAEGYRAAGGQLPDDWREVALLLDLANMCSFLERRENYRKTFGTARAVVLSTLEHFDR